MGEKNNVDFIVNGNTDNNLDNWNSAIVSKFM